MYGTGQMLKLSFTPEGKLMDLIILFSGTENKLLPDSHQIHSDGHWLLNYLAESVATASQKKILK